MKAGSLFLKIHRILGCCLSILFLMWFASGLVMMYHTYPKVTDRQILEHAEVLDSTVCVLPALRALAGQAQPVAALAYEGQPITSLSLYRRLGRDILRVYTPGGDVCLDAATGQALPSFSAEDMQQLASLWNEGAVTAPPMLLDTLHTIDVWTIGVQPFREWPVYRYALPGDEGAELYLSSRTGEALQWTTRSSRLWAWLGAIPHWIYITGLRAHGRQPWTDVVLWLSGIGIVVVISGLYVGIRSSVLVGRHRRRRASKSVAKAPSIHAEAVVGPTMPTDVSVASTGDVKRSTVAPFPAHSSVRRTSLVATPYRKPLLRWHHLVGLVFGLFVLTWIFSGFMSLAKVPQWLVPVHDARDAQADIRGVASLTLDDYVLTPADLLSRFPDVRRLTWTAIAGHPVYRVETSTDLLLVDAAATTTARTASAACTPSTASLVPIFPTACTPSTASTLTPYIIDESTCRQAIILSRGDSLAMSIDLLTEQDHYYINLRQPLPLPVYRIEVADRDGSTYYLCPRDGSVRYTNRNTRLRAWLYRGLHCFYSSWAARYPLAKRVLMWVLMLGGCVCSVTGLWLSVRYLRRHWGRKYSI